MMKRMCITASVIWTATLLGSCNMLVLTTTPQYVEPLPFGSSVELISPQGMHEELEFAGNDLAASTGCTTAADCNSDGIGPMPFAIAPLHRGQVVQSPPVQSLRDRYPYGYAYGSIKEPSIRATAGIAYSRLLSPRSVSPFYSYSIREGFSLGADIGFRIVGSLYAGPRYDRFSSSSSSSASASAIQENIAINFFALQLSQMINLGQGGNSVTLAFAMGSMHYNRSGNGSFIVAPNSRRTLPYEYKGNNLGLRLAGSYDIRLSSDTQVTLGFGLATATIKYLYEDIGGAHSRAPLEPAQFVSLTRLDLGAAFAWFF